jgi:ABC-type proline/glycine betaine transport system substrate-binding protein
MKPARVIVRSIKEGNIDMRVVVWVRAVADFMSETQREKRLTRASRSGVAGSPKK